MCGLNAVFKSLKIPTALISGCERVNLCKLCRSNVHLKPQSIQKKTPKVANTRHHTQFFGIVHNPKWCPFLFNKHYGVLFSWNQPLLNGCVWTPSNPRPTLGQSFKGSSPQSATTTCAKNFCQLGLLVYIQLYNIIHTFHLPITSRSLQTCIFWKDLSASSKTKRWFHPTNRLKQTRWRFVNSTERLTGYDAYFLKLQNQIPDSPGMKLQNCMLTWEKLLCILVVS